MSLGRSGLFAALAGLLSIAAARAENLPYDRSNPVFYDNDDIVDVYTDEYLYSLAAAGSIHLIGVSTSSSVQPYNKWVGDISAAVSGRDDCIAFARQSGFKNLPDQIRGIKGNLSRPPSGNIEDTRPIGSAASRAIVKAARQASASKPLVVVAGGPLTVAVDAYLLDPAIATTMVVAWLGGSTRDMNDYNGWADHWAAYIAAMKLRLVVFPLNLGRPIVTKARIASDLPRSPLKTLMYEKHHSSNSLPDDHDGDGPPAISLMRSDFVTSTKRVSVGRLDGFKDPEHPLPVFRDDPDGPVIVVTGADEKIATEEFWRALTDAFVRR